MIARCFSAWLGAALLLATPFAAPHVRADDNPGLIKMGESDMSDNRARAHFKVGTSLYDSGRFEEAAAEWENAYALSKREALLYNIYVANRDASDLPKAIDALRRYLATDVVDPKQRLNLEARLSAMQGSLDAANQAQAAEADAPLEEPEPVPVEPAPSEPAPVAESSGGSIVPLVLVISGGALVAGGLVMGLVTNGKVSQIEKACPGGMCPASFDLEDRRSSARTLAAVTDLLLVSGAVVASVGIVFWLMGDDEEAEPTSSASARVTPGFVCAPTGCTGSISGRF